MKKLLLIVGAAALLFLAVPSFAALDCEQGYYEKDGVCVANPSTPAWMLKEAQCKYVVYSPWSACVPQFGVQFRTIVARPAEAYNCPFTTRQQVETIRFCDGSGFFGDSIK